MPLDLVLADPHVAPILDDPQVPILDDPQVAPILVDPHLPPTQGQG